MADRLSELQDIINNQAVNFVDSIGIIQQAAQPSFFPEFDWKIRINKVNNPIIQAVLQGEKSPDLAKQFAKSIKETAVQINYLIDGLPEEDLSLEIHNATLSLLYNDYIEGGKNLLQTVDFIEKKLQFVREQLIEISQVQLTCESIESEILRNYYG